MASRIYAEIINERYYLVTDGQISQEAISRKEAMQAIASSRNAAGLNDAPYHCGKRMVMVSGSYVCSKCGASY